jgi:fatty acid synthase
LIESGVDRRKVTYVEAHGTGTQAGDKEEFHALHTVFSQCLDDRKTPLLIGSVKSNMGHTEGTSGLCSLAKIVIMCQEGSIPANLHYKSPQYGMRAIRNGTIQVRKRDRMILTRPKLDA